MTPRERYEQLERQILSPYAALAAETVGRERPDTPCDFRTVFQRDRDRILHSKAFRRLKHKTQVFLAPEGDHYRTRMTHTLEVSQIARTISRALRLNEDLTEAIAMGHDLGHTPFGHAGERALNVLLEGGFRHYEQSVRVVSLLENDGCGLNLTGEVIDGILCHTKGTPAKTLEGRVVRLADRIAYLNHDMDDAVTAGLIAEIDIPADIRRELGNDRTARIDTLIASVVENSKDDILLDDRTQEYFDKLLDFMYNALYYNPVAKGEERKVEGMLGQLFEYFCAHPENLPAEYALIREKEGTPRAVADFIAGMTDLYAENTFRELFIPHRWHSGATLTIR